MLHVKHLHENCFLVQVCPTLGWDVAYASAGSIYNRLYRRFPYCNNMAKFESQYYINCNTSNNRKPYIENFLTIFYNGPQNPYRNTNTKNIEALILKIK